MGSNSADYNAGYGRVAGSENRPVDVSTRDGNGNRVIVDGLILTGEDQSTFSRTTGVFDSYTGVGAQGRATAIGNSLVVVTQGNYNTVIVNSTQTNTGNVSASATASSGGVGNGQ
ncbi:MAG TPA: holdfast anchoring protein HfaA [Phenylobacterium sp.]|nr:holdfast anchoring protein HfaA [Phenylobacterium sp.]HQN50864.1 holdfast anchoring protein HfaA [Phenylobacterium sp.]HQP18955.1 holdfast anchoring protein HfaA [Phenylobacterium sp.]